jgi:hypothetical protein
MAAQPIAEVSGYREPFDHWVLTRFNLRFAEDSELHLDVRWLFERLTLLEQYTAASLDAQGCEMFTWAVLVDSASPGWIVDRIAALPRAQIVYVNGVSTAESIRAALERSGWRGGLTTRLDSDDMLLAGTLQRVRTAAQVRGDGVYSCPTGYQLKSGRIYWRPYLQNPFISLRASDGSMVLDFEHWDLRGRRVSFLGLTPGWVQVLHGGNVANDVRGVRLRGRAAAQRLSAAGAPDVPRWQRERDWLRDSLRTSVSLVLSAVRAAPRVARVFVRRPG